ncbi:MAG: RNA-binding domain-containing protein, partial [Thermodesulfobacteriota bacterium]
MKRLDGEPADAVESETLECKPWELDPGRLKEQLREVREAVVCLANARGGAILLGIRDRKRTRREAITGVGDLDPDAIRRSVYDGTDPHILVDIEEVTEPEGRVLVVHVPRGLGVHTTSEGVAKIRIGKECKPLTGSMLTKVFLSGGAADMTALSLPGASFGDLDPEMIRQLQRDVETQGAKPELARLAPEEFLGNLGLVRDDGITMAAVLLLGRSKALTQWASQHEVIFMRYTGRTRYDIRHNLKAPILSILDTYRRLLETFLRVFPVGTMGFGEIAAPELTWWSGREALLNALVHRDYFVHQSVHVDIRENRIEISS